MFWVMCPILTMELGFASNTKWRDDRQGQFVCSQLVGGMGRTRRFRLVCTYMISKARARQVRADPRAKDLDYTGWLRLLYLGGTLGDKAGADRR